MLKLIALLWGLVVRPADAEVWERTYGSPDYREEPTSIAALPDGGFIIAGEKSLWGPCQPRICTLESYIYLLRLDALGDTIWSKAYSTEKGFGGMAMAPLRDGGFVVMDSEVEMGKGAFVHILRLDSQGDTLWTRKYYGDHGAMAGNSVVELRDGDFMLTGMVFTSPLEGAFLMCMSPDGRPRWMRIYPGEMADSTGWMYHGRYLASLPDGFIVAGTAFFFTATDHRGSSISKGIYIIRTDLQGNPIWQRRYDQEGMILFAKDIAPAPDGGFWVVGHRMPESDTLDVKDIRAYVLRLDSSGDVIWDWAYEVKPSTANFVAALQDGGCLLVAYTWAKPNRIFLLRLDVQGNMVWSWSRTYGEDTWISSGVLLPDGGLVLVGGKKTQEDINGTDIYFLRLSAEELSGAPTVEEEQASLPYTYRLGPCYPNPFNARLVVPFSLGKDGKVCIKIFNPDGRLVRKFAGKFPAGKHRWVWDGRDERGRTVASGVYIIRMEAGSFWASEKVALVR